MPAKYEAFTEHAGISQDKADTFPVLLGLAGMGKGSCFFFEYLTNLSSLSRTCPGLEIIVLHLPLAGRERRSFLFAGQNTLPGVHVLLLPESLKNNRKASIPSMFLGHMLLSQREAFSAFIF